MATKVTVVNNGPVKIEGEIELVDMNGNAFDLAGKSAIFLCRCGESSKKPFCDGTHKTCGFTSEVVAA